MKQSLTCGFRGLFIMKIKTRGRPNKTFKNFCVYKLKEKGIVKSDTGCKIYLLGSRRLISTYKKHVGEDIQSDFDDYMKIKNEKNGYVYIFGNLEYKIIKIGYAKDPYKRISAVQTGCPFDLEILKVFEGNLTLEKQLHDKYKKYHLRGEWFKLEGKLKDNLEL